MKMSFYDWCISNNHEELLSRWDYDLNQQTPENVGFRTNESYYFKCPNEVHASQKYTICTITRGSGICQCKVCYLRERSFGVWCERNNPDLLSLWDYDLNDISPYDIPFRTNKDYYFKCKNGIHKSFAMRINTVVSAKLKVECKECYLSENSFYAWCIMNNTDAYLLWDYEKNTLSPKEVCYCSNKKYWFKCPRGIHASRHVALCNIIDAKGCVHCPECYSIGQYIVDNFGEKELSLVWDYDKNQKSPFHIYAHSGEKVYIKCKRNDEHGSFPVSAGNYIDRDSGCPECNYERVASKLQEKVSDYITTKYNLHILHEFDCSIIARNPKTGYLLPYDNDVVIGNGIHLIIEVHGEQHYKITGYGKKKAKRDKCTPEEILKRQQYRDQVKKEYALKNNYYYLAIPFWEEKNDMYQCLIDDIMQKIYIEHRKGE
jgi:hypothetical protein